MSRDSRTSLVKSRSQSNFGFLSPQGSRRGLSRNMFLKSPHLLSPETSSTQSSIFQPLQGKALKIRRMPPVEEMFRKTVHDHSGTLLPEHLYHPPRSGA